MFWAVTPREAMVILDGADARDRTQLRVMQAVAWATAQLVAVGFHRPKDFPKFDKAFPDRGAKRVAQNPDAIFATMASWAEATRITAQPQTKGSA